MANEIRLSTGLSITNGNFVVPQSNLSQTIDQSVAGGGNPGTVSIGTTEEVISFGDITTLGILRVRNLDPTNFVKWGPESGGAMVVAGKIKAGEEFILRLMPGTTYRMQADTAACKVLIQAYED